MKSDSICVIPAKGQSQRIPCKNMALLAGKPLLQYTLEAARASGVLDVIMVSTDDAEIAEFARAHGAETPYLRDQRLVSDSVSMADVVLDVVGWYAEQHG